MNEHTGDTTTSGQEREQVECCGAHPKDAEAVPISVLEKLAENWTDDAELFLDPDDENVHSSERGAALQQLSCAEQIEELAERYQHTGIERDGDRE